MTPADRIFRYATRYRLRHQDSHAQFPTFRQAAHALRLKLSEVEDACEDAKGNGMPLDIVVGIRCGGLGGGTYGFEHMGEYQVETWDEEDKAAAPSELRMVLKEGATRKSTT